MGFDHPPKRKHLSCLDHSPSFYYKKPLQPVAQNQELFQTQLSITIVYIYQGKCGYLPAKNGTCGCSATCNRIISSIPFM